MRAQIDSLNGVIPGSLIAVRESEAAPWIVSVVRWFRRLMVDYVEIGVEYLGREPRFVKLVTDCDRRFVDRRRPAPCVEVLRGALPAAEREISDHADQDAAASRTRLQD